MPTYRSGNVTVHHADALAALARIPDSSVDSIVTDPPYGLGFMGRAWDDLPPGLPWARECLRVLKPGGHLLAFGGTRTWHRLACAVEDAGFEMRDSIAWLYGSGFPKSLDVSKAIDKARGDGPAALAVTTWLRNAVKFSGLTRQQVMDAGSFTEGQLVHWLAGTALAGPIVPSWEQWQKLRQVIGFSSEMDAEIWRLNGRKGTVSEAWERREVLGMSDELLGRRSGIANGTAGHHTVGGTRAEAYKITAPATNEARQWQGWGTALKPAFEPIVVARKPLVGTVAQNVLAHGTGALNIDATRIAGENPSVARRAGSTSHLDGQRSGAAAEHDAAGRIVSRTSPERFAESRPGEQFGRWPANVVLDEDQAAALDQQSGIMRDGVAVRRNREGVDANPNGIYSAHIRGPEADMGYGGSGGASRFFGTFGHDFDCCTDGSHLLLEGLEERFRYVAKAPKSERPVVDGVAHPTVKPLALMRWLVRLVTPPGGLILDPFAGSGTTVEAAIMEGFAVTAIERGGPEGTPEARYLAMIEQRIRRARARQP